MTGICGLVGPETGETATMLERMLDTLAMRGTSRRTVKVKIGNTSYVLGVRESPSFGAGGLFSNGILTLAIDGYFCDDAIEKFLESPLPGSRHLKVCLLNRLSRRSLKVRLLHSQEDSTVHSSPRQQCSPLGDPNCLRLGSRINPSFSMLNKSPTKWGFQ